MHEDCEGGSLSAEESAMRADEKREGAREEGRKAKEIQRTSAARMMTSAIPRFRVLVDSLAPFLIWR